VLELKTWANEVQIFALEDAGSPKFCLGSFFSPVDAPAERAFEDTWEVI
jgi:hypothetical protein